MKKTAIILIILFACVVAPAQHGNGHGTTAVPEKRAVWLDNGLGSIDHPVTTKNPEAQKFFNQGLALRVEGCRPGETVQHLYEQVFDSPRG